MLSCAYGFAPFARSAVKMNALRSLFTNVWVFRHSRRGKNVSFISFIRQSQIVGATCAVALAVAAGAPPMLLAQGGAPYDQRFDLTQNATVDSSDASTAASVWADLADANLCALGAQASVDVSGDGCLDVADVQQVAARISVPAPRIARAETLADATVWTVNSASDDPDAAPGDGSCRTENGKCTLRAAIAEANRSTTPDQINFSIRNGDGSCPSVVNIFPDSELRGALTLDDARGLGTVIDGYTQCGASPNSGAVAGNAAIKIELRGRFQKTIHGLRVLSANNVVRGLALFNWDRQIEVYSARAKYNHIEGNILGSNAAQTFVSSGMGTHHSEGIRIQADGSYNVIGCGQFGAGDVFQPCTDPAQVYAARNMVIGNGNDGVHLQQEVMNNHITGNYIGVKQDGVSILKNSSDGVDFESGPKYNWLGGTTELERNVISGNGSEGIEISHERGTQFNHVAGNYFGLDATGTKAVPNHGNGVSFEDTVDQNYAHGNYVSGNSQSGFRFYVLTTKNEVRNNYVGVAGDGITPLPNRKNGVFVMGGSQHNLISENVIANNPWDGIYVSAESDSDHNNIGKTYYNTITKNQIYANGKKGIEFYSKNGIFANENLPAPKLQLANNVRVSGTACPGCSIEIFVADDQNLGSGDAGEGKTFVGVGMSDGAGNFTFDIANVAIGTVLTSTATDVKGNTSMFGANIAVKDVPIGEPTAAPTLTSTPTFTPSPTLSPTVTPTLRPGETPPTRTPVSSPSQKVWVPITRR